VIHTGALFELTGDTLCIVALDGFRLALRREKVESQIDVVKFVAPGQALREVEHILEDSDEKKTAIVIGGRYIMFEMEGFTVISRLLDGDFLDYKKAIPTGNPIELKVNTRGFLECVERVSLLVNDKIKNPVKLVCGKENINLSLHTPLGSATDSCFCKGDGGETERGFNHRYLIDAMKAVLPDENVTLKIGTALSPCVIEPEEGDSYLFMVLPVRLKRE
jgi:DNA polymerase-3 subunit beta